MTNSFIIKRIVENEDGIFGTIIIEHKIIGFTLELPWRMNEEYISCIPAGTYKYKKYYSEKFNRECINIINVFSRKDVEMHPGNIITDTNGCILPGLKTGKYKNLNAVLDSNKCLDLILFMLEPTGLVQIIDI